MDESISKALGKHGERIAALEEGQDALEKRMDKNDKTTEGIFKLATNMENLTAAVEKMGERMEKGLSEQGKRIGALENAVLLMQQNDEKIKDHEKRLDMIEREPANKWNKLQWLFIAGIATAILGYFLAKLGA